MSKLAISPGSYESLIHHDNHCYMPLHMVETRYLKNTISDKYRTLLMHLFY